MCRNRQPCRIDPRGWCNSRIPHRRGTFPCSGRRESGRGHRSLARFFHAALSQSLSLAVGAILWRADEHLDEVVVQRVVELALEGPFKLRVVEVAGMQVEVVSVDGNGFVFELDDDLN